MINCKAYADEILDSITGNGHLAVISVGNDPASQSYIKGKKKDCERVGFGFTHCAFKDGAIQDEIADCIRSLNENSEVTGIILQLPVPESYDAEWLSSLIYSSKDVDGLSDISQFKPCTPEGIVYLLKKELGELTGKHAVVIGRGKLVGKPLSKMLLDEDMTVSVCHSKTTPFDLEALTENADAVVVAAGVPKHFKLAFVSPDAVVVDCGIHRMKDGKLCGDVDFAGTERITPVPGGVGLLTRAMLIKHVERKREDENA
ncbi:MAG: bifunctional 5,10-methylenetetrahydrofolate dehydrogenase/5,10-methenyltetrahydrofolate cyclohydrolase [Oscillospiraceae bacterium]|nr:bifunctional 5,10-methylenetetrahydrofolate dehydrogenase/5,10-methenyltetrahydrofolate cyclohydrolase [Oscillospiraceae bacterium]